MSFLTNSLVFKLLSFFVRSLISLKEDRIHLGNINTNGNIIFALPSESIIDLIVLNEICNKYELPLPIESLANSNIKKFVLLKSPKYSVVDQRFTRQKIKFLEEIVKNYKDISIIPVSIFWGNRPDKKQSFFKIVFSPSWKPAGSLKKIFKLLVHGRDLRVQFENNLDVGKEINPGEGLEKNCYLITRYLRAVFGKSKKAMLGPDISHRRTLVKSLVRNKRVREEIDNLSEGNERRKVQLTKKAHRYANEICSDLNYSILSLLASGFTWFWNTRYEGLHTKNLEKIKAISKENALIYLPCHRSHIDYCALTYLLYENGLMVPQVAAGNNLNLPFLGSILRGAGAVFMRRSFMSNPLYSIVFFEHIMSLMIRGSSIEFFPEGGRSRTGLSLPSRPGLLSLTIRSFASLRGQNVKIVPIYIGYEKILEGQSYISELTGDKKKKESIFDPLKVFKDFRNYLGNAYLNFADPIDLNEFLENNVGKDFFIDSPTTKPDWIDEITSKLGQSVTRSVNNSIAVTSTSLFSVALLTDVTQTMTEEVLSKRIQFFLKLIKLSEDYKNVWITQTDIGEILHKTEKLGFISPILINTNKIYKPTPDQIATLSFYKNNISHLFMLYSLLCVSVKFSKSVSKEEIIKLIKMVYPIFSRDFHLKNESIETESIENALNVLIKEEILQINNMNEISSPDLKDEKFNNYLALTNLSEPALKRFYIVMSTIWKNNSMNKEDLKNQCKEIAQGIEVKEGWPYPEFSDNAKFENFIYMMRETKFFRQDTQGNLTAAKITKKAKESYDKFFDKEFLELIGNSTN